MGAVLKREDWSLPGAWILDGWILKLLTIFALPLNLPSMSNPRFLRFQKLGILCVLVMLSLATVRAANSDSLSGDNLPPPVSGSNEALRAYLQLQDQIHETQLSIE